MSLISDVTTELVRLKQDKKTLVKFAITMAIALGIIGLVIFIWGSVRERAYWFWSGSGLFLLLGFAMPVLLRPVHKLWMGLAFVMGWFVSRVILTILFYLVITPIGLIMRLSGKDILSQRLDRQATTYWIRREHTNVNRERYEKMF